MLVTEQTKIGLAHDRQKRTLLRRGFVYLSAELISEGATIDLSKCHFESELHYGGGIYFKRKTAYAI